MHIETGNWTRLTESRTCLKDFVWVFVEEEEEGRQAGKDPRTESWKKMGAKVGPCGGGIWSLHLTSLVQMEGRFSTAEAADWWTVFTSVFCVVDGCSHRSALEANKRFYWVTEIVVHKAGKMREADWKMADKMALKPSFAVWRPRSLVMPIPLYQSCSVLLWSCDITNNL